MQMQMGNQSRVNPDSYHTTQSLSDNHDRVSSLGNRNFRLTPRVSYTHTELFRSHHVSLTPMFQAFRLRGLTVPFLLHPTHIIYISFYVLNRETYIGRHPKYELTTHSSTMMMDDHTHAQAPCHAMIVHQCNVIVPLHYMSCPMYNDYYKDILIPYTTSCTMDNSCLMQTLAINHASMSIYQT